MDSSNPTPRDFCTASDTLLSDLLLDNDFSIAELSQVLNVLRDPTFDLTQLSLQNASDTYSGLSRSQSQSLLPLQRDSSSDCAGMPIVILELVLQYISASRASFHDIAMESKPTPLSESAKTLVNMSLVHRTWTGLAQRVLAYRVQVHGVDGIRRALVSSVLGPWTRELSFTYAVNRRIHTDFDGECSTVVFPYLCALLQKFQNLRLLSIWTYFDTDNFDIRLIQSLLATIKGLEGLNGLWLLHRAFRGAYRTGGNPGFAELCLVLPEIRRLEYLCLTDWGLPVQVPERITYSTQAKIHTPKWKVHDYSIPPPPPLQLTPCKYLKSISQRWRPQMELPVKYVDWLLRPRGSYAIDALSITLTTPRSSALRVETTFVERDETESNVPLICDPQRFLEVISDHFSGLTTLQLNIHNVRRWSYLVQLLNKCNTVRRLSILLECYLSSESFDDFDFPPTVEELHVRIQPRAGNEAHVLGTFARCLECGRFPSLKSLSFTSMSSYVFSPPSPEVSSLLSIFTARGVRCEVGHDGDYVQSSVRGTV